eukprot:6195117-Pleurochrysis_carterae.AAC.5
MARTSLLPVADLVQRSGSNNQNHPYLNLHMHVRFVPMRALVLQYALARERTERVLWAHLEWPVVAAGVGRTRYI